MAKIFGRKKESIKLKLKRKINFRTIPSAVLGLRSHGTSLRRRLHPCPRAWRAGQALGPGIAPRCLSRRCLKASSPAVQGLHPGLVSMDEHCDLLFTVLEGAGMGFPSLFLFMLLLFSVFKPPTFPPHLPTQERQPGGQQVHRRAWGFPVAPCAAALERRLSLYPHPGPVCPSVPLPTQRESETHFLRQMSIFG